MKCRIRGRPIVPTDLEISAAKKEKGRILFTGSAGRVIDDLMKRVPPEYQLDKCQPVEQSFVHKLNTFDPHVIVACLSDESSESMRMFMLLEGSPLLFELPVIAIGNDEDCATFRKYVFHKNTQIFERPLNRDKFFETLETYAELQMQVVASQEPPPPPQKSVPAAPAADAAAENSAPEVSSAPTADVAAPLEMRGTLGESGKKKGLSSLGDGRATILVVDDDVRMLNMAKLCLQDLYDVVVVPSGKLALKYLSKKSADLVLLDYMMPEEDGPMVLRQIRQNSPQPDIPVLFLTGVDDREMVLRGLEFHPKGYMLKPVTREMLIAKVTEILLGL